MIPGAKFTKLLFFVTYKFAKMLENYNTPGWKELPG
jgi:hypothetical protein